MSYMTVEVELDNGHVTPRGPEILPAKARALLTILDPDQETSRAANRKTDCGLRRFLSSPGFPLTPEQFRASMKADFFDQ